MVVHGAAYKPSTQGFESAYPDIFNTSDDDEYESGDDQQQLTRMEAVIDAHKSKTRAKLIVKSRSGDVVKFSRSKSSS